MPPKTAGHNGNVPLSLRFKYGIHTFFLIVEPTDPFSTIDAALLEAIHERHYPMLATDTEEVPIIDPATNRPELDLDGNMKTEFQPVNAVEAPSKIDDYKIEYGSFHDPYDISKGAKNMNIQPDDTPLSRGIKDNAVIAFVVRKASEADEPARFQAKQTRWEAEEEEKEEEPAPRSSAAKGKGKERAVPNKGKGVDRREGQEH